ncbi:MAG: hypothetical protein ACRDS1_16540, partial [Pseudonocardiaceae bacterium]
MDSHPADPFGDPDRDAARLELKRERLDLAEGLATASVRRWQGGRQLSRTQTGIVLVTALLHLGLSTGRRRGRRGDRAARGARPGCGHIASTHPAGASTGPHHRWSHRGGWDSNPRPGGL